MIQPCPHPPAAFPPALPFCGVEGVNWRTVEKLQTDAARAARRYHRKHIVKVRVNSIQIDELRSFCYAKQHRVGEPVDRLDEAGDVWTWLALDADVN